MPNILQMGVPGTTPGYQHPKMSNHFVITFQGIGGSADSQNLTRQCISGAKPTIDFNPIEIHRYNSKAFIAGKYSWSPIDLQIEDDITNGAVIVIQQQLEKQISLTSTGTVPLGLNAAVSGGAYKFTANLVITNGQGADGSLDAITVEKWTLQGCWLSNVNFGELNWESDDPTRVSMTLHYDHAFVEYNNKTEPSSALIGG